MQQLLIATYYCVPNTIVRVEDTSNRQTSMSQTELNLYLNMIVGWFFQRFGGGERSRNPSKLTTPSQNDPYYLRFIAKHR